MEKFDYMEFNKVLDTFSNHSTTIINYFEERLTNASAESFNAKAVSFQKLGEFIKENGSPGLLLFIPFAPVFQ